jgi:hypothetical protein
VTFNTFSGLLVARRNLKSEKPIEIELPAGSLQSLLGSGREDVKMATRRAAGANLDILDVMVERSGGHPGFKEYVVVVLNEEVDIKSLNVNTSEFVSISSTDEWVLTSCIFRPVLTLFA